MTDQTERLISSSRDPSFEPRIIFSTVYKRQSTSVNFWRPPTDIYETSDKITIQVEIAGMRGSEIRISIDDKTLIIHGYRAGPSEQRSYHQMEIPFGEFLSLINLHSEVNFQSANAKYVDGFLIITIPKIL